MKLKDRFVSIEEKLKAGAIDEIGKVTEQINELNPEELAEAAQFLYLLLEEKAGDAAVEFLDKYAKRFGNEKMMDLAIKATHAPNFPKPLEIYFVAVD